MADCVEGHDFEGVQGPYCVFTFLLLVFFLPKHGRISI
jgi:hypothetical protein